MDKKIYCLNECNIGDQMIITNLEGSNSETRHLEDMGLFRGSRIDIINKLNDNYIISVFSARIALDLETSSLVYGSLVKKNEKVLTLNKNRK